MSERVKKNSCQFYLLSTIFFMTLLCEYEQIKNDQICKITVKVCTKIAKNLTVIRSRRRIVVSHKWIFEYYIELQMLLLLFAILLYAIQTEFGKFSHNIIFS